MGGLAQLQPGLHVMVSECITEQAVVAVVEHTAPRSKRVRKSSELQKVLFTCKSTSTLLQTLQDFAERLQPDGVCLRTLREVVAQPHS